MFRNCAIVLPLLFVLLQYTISSSFTNRIYPPSLYRQSIKLGFALSPSSLPPLQPPCLPLNRPQQHPQQALPLPFPFASSLGKIMLVVLDVLLQLGVRTKRVDQASVVDQVHDADVHALQYLFFRTDRSAYKPTKPNQTKPNRNKINRYAPTPLLYIQSTKQNIPSSYTASPSPAPAPPPLPTPTSHLPTNAPLQPRQRAPAANVHVSARGGAHVDGPFVGDGRLPGGPVFCARARREELSSAVECGG